MTNEELHHEFAKHAEWMVNISRELAKREEKDRPEDSWYWDSPISEASAEWCRKILEAANRYDAGGCILCRS